MTHIEIHPAVVRQEDNAHIEFLRRRNLQLAQRAHEQSALLTALSEERDGLRARVDELERKVLDLAKVRKKPKTGPKPPAEEA